MPSEPMTLATDWLVAGCALFWAARLARQARAGGQRTPAWWAAALVATAVASLAGGAWHGFRDAMSPAAAAALWKTTLLVAGVVGFAILGASFTTGVRPPARTLLMALAGVKLAVYLAWMSGHEGFHWVILDYGSSMVLALALHLHAWWRRRDPAAPWIVAAIAVSFAGAAVQASGFALHRHFNHNDLFHLVQLCGLWLFQRGASLARDREAIASPPRQAAAAPTGTRVA